MQGFSAQGTPVDLTQDSPLKHSPDLASMPSLLSYHTCEKEVFTTEISETSSDISISPVDIQFPETIQRETATEAPADLTKQDVPSDAVGGVAVSHSVAPKGGTKRGRGRPPKASTGQGVNTSEPVADTSAVGGKRGSKRKKSVSQTTDNIPDATTQPKVSVKKLQEPVVAPTPEVMAQVEIKTAMIANWVSDLRFSLTNRWNFYS